MALDQDFLTRVVNVHWGGGLAVEFTERPDYLTMNQALSMNKVVVSFWFRVPTATADAIRKTPTGFFFDYRVFLGVVPLLTWGPQQTATIYGVEQYDSGSDYGSLSPGGSFAFRPIMLERLTAAHSAPMTMSGIGVYAASNTPTMDIHIQTNDHATGVNLLKIATSFTGTPAEAPAGYPRPVYIEPSVELVYTDVSYAITASPDYLGNSSANVGSSGAGQPEIGALDKWHHVLISWELIGHSNMDGASKMWCAIDDVNKNGFDLPAMCNPDLGMGPNDHLAAVPFEYKGSAEASADISFSPIPSIPVHTPGPALVNYATDDKGATSSKAPIYTVEMAELQIFTGVTLDTGVEANRRTFIDFERDADGNPIRNDDGKRTLKPVNPKQAEDLLGKRPDILLHGTTKWQAGKNTGSLGIDADGEEIPSGQFTPTGEIKKYSPDPSIVEA